MKITNKHTGFSFNLSEQQAADFFYCKNAKGEYINKSEDDPAIKRDKVFARVHKNKRLTDESKWTKRCEAS